MKAQMQKGFTLIELMIVVAIIGILAAVALPAYQDYTARSQMSEALSLGAGARTAVTEFYTSNGQFPTGNESAGLAVNGEDIAGKYVHSVEVDGGLIEVTMKGAGIAEGIRGKTMVLSAATKAGSVEWTCKTGGDTPVDSKFLPTSCR